MVKYTPEEALREIDRRALNTFHQDPKEQYRILVESIRHIIRQTLPLPLLTYVVHVTEDGETFIFRCAAESHGHALEQALNAYPEAEALMALPSPSSDS